MRSLIRGPRMGLGLPFRRPFARSVPHLDVNVREVDWDSPEGQRLLGAQHWDRQIWHRVSAGGREPAPPGWWPHR